MRSDSYSYAVGTSIKSTIHGHAVEYAWAVNHLKSFEAWRTEGAGLSPSTALSVGGLTLLPLALAVVVAVGHVSAAITASVRVTRSRNSGPKEGQKRPRNGGWKAKH